MMREIWLLRMARWARRTRSPRTLAVAFGLVLAVALLFIIERYIGWPDWLTVNGPARLRIR